MSERAQAQSPPGMEQTSLPRAITFGTRAGNRLQRACACGNHSAGDSECEDCRRKREGTLQRTAISPTPRGEAPPIVHQVLRAPGQPLDRATRALMEPRFGHDLSGVRVHNDRQAAQSARAVDALAYTVGRDVVFAAGQYAPDTRAGRRLLAHELTHVTQQKNGQALQRQGLSIGPEHDAFEQEAEAFAESFGEEHREHRAPTALSQPRIQRASAKEIFSQIPIFGILVEPLSRLFGGGTFSETELKAYLQHLATKRQIENNYDSDNKARVIVGQWENLGLDKGYGELSATDLKRLLIIEMYTGNRSDPDIEGITTLLRNSTAQEIQEILDPGRGVRLDRLMDLSGEKADRLYKVLEQKLHYKPVDPDRVLHAGAQPCSPLQTFAIVPAQKRAQQIVSTAVDRINGYLAKSDPGGAVGRAIQGYFPGADEAFIQSKLLFVYSEILKLYPTRHYACAQGEIDEATSPLVSGKAQIDCTGTANAVSLLTGPQGVDREKAAYQDKASDQRTFFCSNFFRLEVEEQPITIIHEWAHQAGRLGSDPHPPPFGPGDVDRSTAEKNPESYARLAYALSRIPSDALKPAPGTATGEAR